MAALIRYVDIDGSQWVAEPEEPRVLIDCVSPTETDDAIRARCEKRPFPPRFRFRLVEEMYGPLQRLDEEAQP